MRISCASGSFASVVNMSRSPDEADNKADAVLSELQFSCVSVIDHGLHEA